MEPNYKNYSVDELCEALDSIDKQAYPERVESMLIGTNMEPVHLHLMEPLYWQLMEPLHLHLIDPPD